MEPELKDNGIADASVLFQAVVAGAGMSDTVIAAVCVRLAHTRAAVILKLPGLKDGELVIHRGQGFLSVV